MTTITTTSTTTTESARTTTAAFLAQFAHAAQELATSLGLLDLYTLRADNIEIKPEHDKTRLSSVF